jgi:two-component system response regulator HydG
VDVRVIAATNRDLDDALRDGSFRTDLYYRLNVITLHLPPLRERREDIPLLCEWFLQRLAEQRGVSPKRLSPQALEALSAYHWPGNVRELENALEHAMVLAPGDTIEPDALPRRILEPKVEPLVSEKPLPTPTLEVIERAYIMWVLGSVGGNKTRAAEILGIDPSTLYRKLARYESESA